MITFPFDINEPAITSDALDTLYTLAAGAPTGGMYPVGANNLWHGGVHLSLGNERPVYAAASGRIVAARLNPDPEQALSTYGHTNFILTKHTWPPQATEENGTPYYMLYMHLAPRPLDAVAQTAGAVPWLTGTPLLQVTAESGLTVRYRPRLRKKDIEGAVPNGRLVKPLSEPTEREGYRWQEVKVLRQDLTGYVALGPLGTNGALEKEWTEEAPPPGGTDLVGKLESGTVAALDVPVRAGEMLWWAGQFGQDLGDWAIDDELLAEVFGHAEPIERAPTLHWEVFSFEKAFGLEENGSGSGPAGEETAGLSMPTWTATEDSGTALTFNPEASDAFSLIKRVREEAPDLPDPDDYATLSMDEKKSLHYLETGKKLRTYAVKYASEWGLGTDGTKKALEESPVHDPERDKDDFAALQFWEEVEELPSDNLPADAKVWHYHPVTVLRALAAQTPRFFVDVGREKKEVSTYEEVRDAVFEQHGVPPDIDGIDDLHESKGREAVPSYDTAVEDDLDGTEITVQRPTADSAERFASVEAGPIRNRHGHIVGWKRGVYDVASGSPNLYDMLIEQEKMLPDQPRRGVPNLPEFDANIWASLSESEACLNGINTWDRALVTIGPIQQTVGVGGAKGELQGALHTVWQSAPEAYEQHFGRHGLQIPDDSVDVVQGAKKAHATLHGERLDSAGTKKRLQRFEWVDRLAQAFSDPEVRYWMLQEGFKRLDRIRSRKMTLEVTVEGQDEPAEIQTTIGGIFRRDLSQALLLDWHINAPSRVWSEDNDWIVPVQRRMADWSWVKAPSSEQSATLARMSRSQELQLVATLLQARLGNMTDPSGRAGKILKYAGADLVEEMARSQGYSPNSYETQNDLVTDFLQRVMNENAVEGWSNFIPDATVLTFETYNGTTREN